MMPELMDMILPLTHQRVAATIRCVGAHRPIDHYDRGYTTATPGIIVTRYFANGALQPFPTLTHQPSGGHIGGPYLSLRVALKIAGCLGGLGDWTVQDPTWLRIRIEGAAKEYGLYDWLKEVLAADAKVLEEIAREDVNCEG